MTSPDNFSMLRCPVSGEPLVRDGDALFSARGAYRYPVVSGIPLLLPPAVSPTHDGYRDVLTQNAALQNTKSFDDADAETFFAGMLVPTCGNLFRGVTLHGDYPIPSFPAGLPRNGPLLDIGCSWGRWSIAAALAGHRVIAIDPHLQALFCAQWLARKLVPDNQPLFVLADARSLPFAQNTFSAVFSYSVIQHFSLNNAALTLKCIAEVLAPGGVAQVQMPNRDGLSARLRKPRERKSEGSEFDVRYYTIDDLLTLFGRAIGPATWHPDCFLGLNVHVADRQFVPFSKWPILLLDAALVWLCQIVPGLAQGADSVYVRATKARMTPEHVKDQAPAASSAN